MTASEPMGAAVAADDLLATLDWTKTPNLPPVLPALLAHCEQQRPAAPLLVCDEQRFSYGEVLERSAQLAIGLRRAGIGFGSRVALLLPNSPEFAVAWLAVARIGAVAVPISTLSTVGELRRILASANPQLLIAAGRYRNHDYVARLEAALEFVGDSLPARLPLAPSLRGIWITGDEVPAWAQPLQAAPLTVAERAWLAALEARVTPADPIAIIYTSGTTSEPKGVIHSHGGFLRAARRVSAALPYRHDDRVFVGAPLFWVGGLVVGLLNLMQVGGALLFSERSGRELLDFIARERATYVFVWPNVARTMASTPGFDQHDFGAIRGGNLVEAIPPALRKRNQSFGHALGMTETAGPHTVILPDVDDDMVGSMGPAAPGMEHRIVDVETRAVLGEGEAGELEVRGDTLMLGYVGRERAEVFDADGWFRTGDLCLFRRGHLFFRGRIDDMIKSAGANVSPREVESALAQLPGVAQAHVVGVPDGQRGQVVAALVVPQVGAQLRPETVVAQAATLLSTYKVPRLVRVMAAADVPMTATAKVDRRALIEILSGVDV